MEREELDSTVAEYAAGETSPKMLALYKALEALEACGGEHREFAREVAMKAHWTLPYLSKAA